MLSRNLMNLNLNRSFSIPVLRGIRPERSLSLLQEEMNRLFESYFGEMAPTLWARESSFPALDVIESGKEFKISVELPGMDPDDIEVSVANGFLTIKGEQEEKTEEEGDNYLRRETSCGSFCRTISLPETADNGKAEASFRNGVLGIRVPKKAEALQSPTRLHIRTAA